MGTDRNASKEVLSRELRRARSLIDFSLTAVERAGKLSELVKLAQVPLPPLVRPLKHTLPEFSLLKRRAEARATFLTDRIAHEAAEKLAVSEDPRSDASILSHCVRQYQYLAGVFPEVAHRARQHLVRLRSLQKKHRPDHSG